MRESEAVGKCFCSGTLYFETGPQGESRGRCNRCNTWKDLREDANCSVCGRAKADHPIAEQKARKVHGRKMPAVAACNCDWGFDNRPATPLPFGLRELTQDDKNEIQEYLRR